MFGKNKSADLILKGKNALSIFTKTLADITANTEEMLVEDARLQEEQEKMQTERNAMHVAIKVNESVSDKLEEILGLNQEEDLLNSSTIIGSDEEC